MNVNWSDMQEKSIYGRYKVAITGGIGSGKSFVSNILRQRGIDVYDCDAAAKRLMRNSADLRDALIGLVGERVYVGDVLQKQVLAQFLLASDANRLAVNDVVHPAVARDFLLSGMSWLESAILYDSGFNRRVDFDHVICVTAPLETKVARIMLRDRISRSQALEWIDRQMPQDKVRELSGLEIINDGTTDLYRQIDSVLNKIINR